MIPHKLFLSWLLYIIIVIFLFIISWYAGYLQIITANDPTYITYGIIVLFILTEIYMLSIHIIADKELNYITHINKLFENKENLSISKNDFKDMIPQSSVQKYITNLYDLKSPVNMNLLHAMADNLQNKNYGWFMSDLMIRLGLLGTVVGLIISFMPFIERAFTGGSFDPKQIQGIISELFQGIAAAFFTTAAGIIFGTFTSISSRIYDSGIHAITDKMTCITELKLKPLLENHNEKNQ